MKILIISSYLPYPLFSGGAVRLYNLIRELSQTHEITVICELRNNQTKKDVQEIEKLCKEVITVPRKKQWSISTILQTTISTAPFLVVGHRSRAMISAIERVLQEDTFDIIHVETFYVMPNLFLAHNYKKLPPIILVEHNIEYCVYKKYVDQAPFFLKPFLSIDVRKMKNLEKKSWKNANQVIFVSEQEKSQSEMKDAVVVANGVDVKKFIVHSSHFMAKEKKILFIGDFKWIQNTDAANWILKELWPQVLRSKISGQSSELKLWIVGKNIPDNLRARENENVIFDSSQEDTGKVFQDAYMLLAPIRVGGGTSFKILEAMACGTPVIATALGNEGINAIHNESILIAKTSAEFTKNIQRLVEDEKLYNTIRKNAREHIVKNFDWKQIAKKLNDVYEKNSK